MPNSKRLLILGGTGEARVLAGRLAGVPDLRVVTSLAGATRHPALPAGDVRIGGFGGADGLAKYLDAEGIDLVADATHPYAAQISRHAAAAGAANGVPVLHIVRPPWMPLPGERWIETETLSAAAAKCGACATRIFVAVGRKELAELSGLNDAFVLLRSVDPPDRPPPFRDYVLVTGRGPFSTADEIALLSAHGIGCVLCKNSGGDAMYGKIEAARALGIPVVMLRRPAPPVGVVLDGPDAAERWIRDRLN